MCKCTPGIKTPFCGRPGCEWPHQEHPPEFANPADIPDPLARGIYNHIVGYRYTHDSVTEARIVEAIASNLSGFLTDIPRKAELIEGISRALKAEHGIVTDRERTGEDAIGAIIKGRVRAA